MGFLDFFKKENLKSSRVQTWQELGRYNAIFNSFGTDIYDADVVRSCIRPLAALTSKASCKCSNSNVERLLNGKPNMYMTGPAFLAKCRNLYEIKNTCFVYVQRNEKNAVTGYYPVPYISYKAVEYDNGLFIQFNFINAQTTVLPWEDLAIVRKDYVHSDIAGESNGAIISTLETIATTEQGVGNAVRSTANLRGILKSTKGMLAPEDVKRQKEQFVRDYLGIDNEGGIASLDASQEFTPITMSPVVASSDQMREFRENVYRYFGVNEKVVTSDMTSDEIEAFYEVKIEPFLVELATALQEATFSKREIGFENYLIYEANKLQFASLTKKISLFKEVVLNGGMTVNEWRIGCNMEPIDGGDELIRRLDVGTVDNITEDEGENEDGN